MYVCVSPAECLTTTLSMSSLMIIVMSSHNAVVGYLNGPAMPSFCGHVLRSLVQFLLAQST